MQGRILTILYDLALLIGAENRVRPLLKKTLLRLIYHTAFPCGLILKSPTDGVIQSCEVIAAVGDKYLLPIIGQTVSWPAALVNGPAVQFDAEDLLDSLPLHQDYYRYVLRLPVPGYGVILLFSHQQVDSDIPFSEIFKPIMVNLTHAIELCTNNEKYAAGLIDDRRLAEQALYEEKERALVTLHSIGDAVISTDIDSKIRFMNPVAEDLLSWKTEEAQGRHLDEVFHIINEITRKKMAAPVDKVLRKGKTVTLANHTLLIDRNGKEIAIEDSAAPIRDRTGEIIGVVMVFHDVSKTKKLARKLSWQASHDSLTGLINRRKFEQDLALVLESAREEGATHVLFYIDLDQFKVVNDACGHIAGDELLKQIAVLMQSKVRKNDLLSRLGGDEFGVLLENCDLDQAMDVANAIRETLAEFRFVWEDKQFSIGASIGVVLIDALSQSVTQLMSSADIACYAAKDTGRNRVHIYQEDDNELARLRGEMRWVSRIHDALEENRFELFCQPIIPSEQTDAEYHHYEILVRMIGLQGELILPDTFIPAAERYGLMIEIDRWVIKHSLEFYAQLAPQLNGKPCNFSINLSGASLNQDGLAAFICKQIEEYNIPPQAICFEITETAAIANLGQAQSLMRELRKLGCYFALDDFGSGLSSFSYLKNLPVDYLKIDGGFVRDILIDKIDAAMVSAINQVGHLMGLKTIAEYVEDEQTKKHLAKIGVDYVQGYGIKKPFPLKQISVPAT